MAHPGTYVHIASGTSGRLLGQTLPLAEATLRRIPGQLWSTPACTTVLPSQLQLLMRGRVQETSGAA